MFLMKSMQKSCYIPWFTFEKAKLTPLGIFIQFVCVLSLGCCQ